MEIIFESVKERDKFFEALRLVCCPSDLGFRDVGCTAGNNICKCIECWEKSGLKYSIKSEGPHIAYPMSILEHKADVFTISISDPLEEGDRLVKRDGKWCVERTLKNSNEKCIKCEYHGYDRNEDPCKECVDYSNFEARAERPAHNCVSCEYCMCVPWCDPCSTCTAEFKKHGTRPLFRRRTGKNIFEDDCK